MAVDPVLVEETQPDRRTHIDHRAIDQDGIYHIGAEAIEGRILHHGSVIGS